MGSFIKKLDLWNQAKFRPSSRMHIDTEIIGLLTIQNRTGKENKKLYFITKQIFSKVWI